MKEDDKRVLREWQPILEQFLDAMEMMEELPNYFPLGSPQRIKVYSERKNHHVAVRNLLEIISNESMYLREFVGAIRECHHDWLAAFISGEIEAEEVEKVFLHKENLTTMRHLLTLISRHIKDTIVASDMAEHLRSKMVISNDDFESIKVQSRNDGNRVAVGTLLSILVRKPPGWQTDFLEAMRYLRYDYNLIDSFESLIMDGKLPKRASGDIPEEHDVSDEYKSDDDKATPNPGPKRTATMAANFSPSRSTRDENPKEESKAMKKYQRDLAHDAINGKNVIICAPPCSEKTKVAAHIIYTRFNQQVLQSHDPKIAFIVSRNELVQHHHNIIKSYLSEDAWHTEYIVHNKQNSTLESALRSSNVVVMTAQILIKALDDGSLNSLAGFKMIVFDECQHTLKENSYNKIMSQYLNLKHKGTDLPQIIGLTATLGVDDSKPVSHNVNHLLTLCANLDATGGIVTVPVEYQNEVMEITPRMAEENVSLDVAKDRLTTAICNAIDEVVDKNVLRSGSTDNKMHENIGLFQQGVIKIFVCMQEDADLVSDILGSNCKIVQPHSSSAMARGEANLLEAALLEVTTKIQKMCKDEPKKYIEELKRLQNKYQVQCKNCSKRVCTSADIEKLDTMHTFDANAFKEKFEEKRVEHGGSEEKKGLFCSNCGIKWGIFHKHMHIRIPLLKADALKFVSESDPDSPPLTGKQWHNINIVFRKVTYEELAERLIATSQKF